MGWTYKVTVAILASDVIQAVCTSVGGDADRCFCVWKVEC